MTRDQPAACLTCHSSPSAVELPLRFEESHHSGAPFRRARTQRLLCAALTQTLTCTAAKLPLPVDCSVDEAQPTHSQAQDVADGYVSDSAITAQMGVLNSVYNGVGFGFSLAGVDRTLNADWFQNLQSQTQQEADMTTALHKGNASVVSASPCCPPHRKSQAVHACSRMQAQLTLVSACYAHTHEGVRLAAMFR